MTVHFGYDKRKVIQALRYHFISRREILAMVILVNVFAIASLALYFLGKINSLAFLVGTFLWVVLMISFWFILPIAVYRRAVTFRHEFTMHFEENDFTLAHEKGAKTWPWSALKNFLESPHFFHLYFDSRSFLLVPKTDYMNSDEVFELRKMLRTRVGAGR